MRTKPAPPPPRRITIVAREHDDFGRPILVIDPKTRRPISIDPLNPTEVALDDYWARAMVMRDVVIVPTVALEPEPEPEPKQQKKGKK